MGKDDEVVAINTAFEEPRGNTAFNKGIDSELHWGVVNISLSNLVIGLDRIKKEFQGWNMIWEEPPGPTAKGTVRKVTNDSEWGE